MPGVGNEAPAPWPYGFKAPLNSGFFCLYELCWARHGARLGKVRNIRVERNCKEWMRSNTQGRRGPLGPGSQNATESPPDLHPTAKPTTAKLRCSEQSTAWQCGTAVHLQPVWSIVQICK